MRTPTNFPPHNTVLTIVTVLYSYIHGTYIFYNWKFVPVNAFYPFHLPLNPNLWQPAICSPYLWGFFCFVFLGFLLALFIYFLMEGLFLHCLHCVWIAAARLESVQLGAVKGACALMCWLSDGDLRGPVTHTPSTHTHTLPLPPPPPCVVSAVCSHTLPWVPQRE